MPDYVTHGTVQFTKKQHGAAVIETIQIAPNADYAVKHKGDNYIGFINLAPPAHAPHGALLKADQAFPFAPKLRRILKTAAFNCTCLALTIDETATVIAVTFPATPHATR